MILDAILIGSLAICGSISFGYIVKQEDEILMLNNEIINIKKNHEIELKHIAEINSIKESTRIETGQIAKMQ